MSKKNVYVGGADRENSKVSNTSFVDLFRKSVREHPANIALTMGQINLSYSQLHGRARVLSYHLRQQGVQPGDLVAVHIERSIDAVVAILGVMLSGATYLPMDVNLPQERNAFILQDAKPKLLIINSVSVSPFTATASMGVFLMLSDYPGCPENLPDILLPQACSAYVIYTSGSTGRPKGSLISNHGLSTYLAWCEKAYDVLNGEGVVCHSPISFDLTVTSLLVPLAFGQRVVIIPDGQELDVMAEFLAAPNDISLLKITPAHLRALALLIQNQRLQKDAPQAVVRSVVVGGEELTHSHVQLWLTLFPMSRIFNEYGPTETVVGCCVHEVIPGYDYAFNDGRIPIGTPIDDVQLYIVDEHWQQVVAGQSGELWIAGESVSDGYLFRSALTAEKFLPDVWASKAGARLYRSGDLVRRLTNGELDFLRRIDRQVKIRGYRIEPGEIEEMIRSDERVNDAVVLVQGKGETASLCAYVEFKDFEEAPLEDVRAILAKRLPFYMVPQQLYRVDAIPLTSNGKVDVKALSNIFANAVSEVNDEKIITKTDTERELIAIWKKVLPNDGAFSGDTFFDRGGNSLLAVQLIVQIRLSFAVYLGVIDVFEHPTIAALASLVDKKYAEQGGVAKSTIANYLIEPCLNKQCVPLSFSQQRLFFLNRFDEDSAAYNVNSCFKISGVFDFSALEKSIDILALRHEAFRTTFSVDLKGEAFQCVGDTPNIRCTQYKSKVTTVTELESAIVEQSKVPFDLENGPLLHVSVFRLDENIHYLLVSMHHIICDGLSSLLLWEELSQIYCSLIQDGSCNLAPLPIQYADYAYHQRAQNKNQHSEGLEYWLDSLEGASPVLDLPLDLPRPAAKRFSGRSLFQQVDDELAKTVRQHAQNHGLSVSMFLQAAFYLLLYRLSGQQGIVLGVPSANRQHPDLGNVLGFFVNSLPIRVDVQPELKIRDLLQQVKEKMLRGLDHEGVPFEQIVDALGVDRDLSLTPVFQVMYAYEADFSGPLTLGGAEVAPQNLDYGRALFDLLLRVIDTGTGLTLCFEYDETLFVKSTVERYLVQLINTLKVFVTKPEARINQLAVMSFDERHRVLNEWNTNTSTYSQANSAYFKNGNVVSLFEAQVVERAAFVALRLGEQSLSYEVLNRRANQIAHRLIQSGVMPGVVVGLMIERSIDMMAGLLGIIKAGAVYCPLDLQYPGDRLRYIVEDSGLQHCLVGAVQETLPALAQVARIRVDVAEGYADRDDNPCISRLVQSPLYMMYTSGSTGIAKGVVATHQGVIRLVCGCDFISVDHRDVFLQLSTPTFDASTLEIWGALLNGGELVLAPQQPLAVDELGYLLERYSVTTLWLTAAFLNVVVKEDVAILKGLRNLLAGGDVLSAIAIEQVLNTLGETGQVINGYGPTENTTFTCCHRITAADIGGHGGIPIGKPIANTQVYVLNDSLEPIGVGMVGELYTAGAGVALGYLGKPTLTAENFIPNPFGEPGTRLYRTGDMVRWRADGTLAFIGRVDFQVKIRGFRIELGEVEAALARADGVQEVIVLSREDEPTIKRLVAYVVGDVEEGDLRTYLRSRVPDYMLPSAFVILPSFPITPNGKVDRGALPVPAMASESRYVAPQTQAQQVLCSVWADVLKVKCVGLNDNFFDLGGDSILSIQIASRANKAGYHVSVKDIFSYPSVGALAPHCQAAVSIEAEQGLVEGVQPLLPIQHWFFEQDLCEPDYWNQSFLFDVPNDLNVELAAVFLRLIVDQHDALRLSFATGGAVDDMGARYMPTPIIEIEGHDLSACSDVERASRIKSLSVAAKRGLSVSAGPLVKGVLFTLDQGEKRFLLTVHHLVIDTVSWRVLIDDLSQLYTQAQENLPLALGSKTSSYRQWGEFLTDYAQSDALSDEAAYWKEAVINAKEKSKAFPRQGEANHSRDVVSFSLTAEETRLLLEDVHEAYNTQVNDVLLGALLSAYHAWSSHSSLGLYLEGHGREALSERLDLSRTVGWFTTIFPVTLRLVEQADLQASLISVKECLRAIPNKGIGYGVLRYCHPDADVRAQLQEDDIALSFNYLGQFDQVFSDSPFQFAVEYSGTDVAPNEKHAHSLDIVSMVTEGVLRVNFQYDSGLHSAENMQAFSEAYRQHLSELIRHCCREDVGARTLSDFDLVKFSQAGLSKLCTRFAVESRELDSVYPLSPLQEGMLFESLRHEGSGVYVTQVLLSLASGLDQNLLQEAWNDVMAAFPILRTGFCFSDDAQPLQAVMASASCNIQQMDWRDADDIEKRERLEYQLGVLKNQGFDFTRAPLMALTLIQWSADECKLLWTHHHALIDGWSLPQVLDTLSLAYQARVQGQQPNLPYSAPYEHYIRWLTQQDDASAHRFWANYLSGVTDRTPLPLSRSRKTAEAANGAVRETAQKAYGEFSLSLSLALCDQLHASTRRHRVTLNTLMQAAWGILLGRCVNSADVVFGSVSAGRPPALNHAETIVGAMIATTPVRVKYTEEMSVGEILSTMQHQAVDARDFEYAPLSKIAQISELADGEHLFDTVLAFENYPFDRDANKNTLVKSIEIFEQPHSPFTIAIIPSEQIQLRCFYDVDYYDESTVGRLITLLNQTLEALSTTEDVRVAEIDLLSTAETQQVLWDWNQTALTVANGTANDLNVVALFEEQVALNPLATALISGDERVSYVALNTRVNQLAHRLHELGVVQGTVVGLNVERSVDMIVGLLAIVKSGGLYCPLDANYPDECLRYIIHDSGLAFALTGVDVSLPSGCEHVNTLSLSAAQSYSKKHENPASQASSQAGLYIMYTSGSTGLPKGTVVKHEGVIRLAKNSNYVDITKNDVLLQLSTCAFDASTFEIWGALLNGACLVLAPAGKVSVEEFGQLLDVHNLSILFITSAFFNVVVQENVQALKNIRQLYTGGEVLSIPLAKKMLTLANQQGNKLFNVYGPTENTTYTCFHRITEQDVVGDKSVAIGQAISDTQVYILSEALTPLGVGMMGELYTAGAGLAWGYLGKGALTAERFVPNPFGEPGSRLYRTGDLACWRSDGSIEFIGRADFQVKIRGFRVELGEVEAILVLANGVQEVIVLMREDEPGIKRLVAYLVGEINLGSDLSVENLREYANANMPDYMVPSAFVVLERFPLNNNGKVDRRALPVPSASLNQHYHAPQTAAERTLCQIWERVLKIKRIGLHDNFFELGGDSILSLQIASRANKAGVRVSVKDIFSYPSVGQLAPHCKETVDVDAEQRAIQGGQDFLPVQHWFFEQAFSRPEYYNQSFLLTVPADLSFAQLVRYFQLIEAQHDVFRMRFSAAQAHYLEQGSKTGAKSVTEHTSLTIAQHDLSGISAEEQKIKLEQLSVQAKMSLSLEYGPLYQCRLFTLNDQEKRLFFTAHHLIIDTISWRIIIDDLVTLYSQDECRKPLILADKTSSYQRWGNKLTAYATSEAALSELPYWDGVVQQGRAEFVCNKSASFFTRSRISATLNEVETRALLGEVNDAYNTQINDVLLSALLSAYHAWSSSELLCLSLEGHGREDLFERIDLSRTVGWFTSIFPVNLQLGSDLAQTLIAVKETLNAIPNKGIGYGVLRYLHPDANIRETLNIGTRDISFNYLGQFDQSFKHDAFQFAAESTGGDISINEKDAHGLNLVSMVRDACFWVDFHFDDAAFSRDEMQALLSLFVEHLRALIRHCIAPEHGARTPSDFALAHLTQNELDQLCSVMDIHSRAIEDIYPLSPLQRGMLFESLRHEGAGVYVTQMLLTLPGDIDADVLEHAWRDVISAFPIFRTAFALEQVGQLQQIVLDTVPFEMGREDWQALPSDERALRLDCLIQSSRCQKMDFSRAPLMTLTLVRVSDLQCKLLWTHHHALLDGWSLPNVFNALNQAYHSRLNQQAPMLQYSAPYKHYIQWLEQSDTEAAEQFWCAYLQGVTEKTALPFATGASSLTEKEKHYGVWDHSLSHSLCQKLEHCTRQARVTLNTLVQAAWGILLSRAVNSHDVVFGAVSACRPASLAHAETIVGAMIATVPVRIKLLPDTCLNELLGELQEQSVQARDFEYAPLSSIQACSDLPASEILFDTVLAFENFPFENNPEHKNIIQTVDGYEQPHGPLTLAFIPGKQLQIRIFYDAHIYSQSSIERLTQLFVHTLESFLTGLGKPLCQLPVIPQKDRQIVVNEWNDTAAAYPVNNSVTGIFEKNARGYPEAIAVIFENQSLSYGELNARANQLAHYLHAQGIGPGHVVGLMVERSLEMMLGMLAIIKTGAVFCPLDPEYPSERIHYIIQDAALQYVLIGDDPSLLPNSLDLTAIQLTQAENYSSCTENLSVKVTVQSPLYVMYTSGSTGMPKGVVATHEAVIRLVCGCDYVMIDPSNVFLQMSAPSFDAATFEVWGALLNGAKLVLAPAKKLTVEDLGQLLYTHKVTTLFLTSAFFNVVVKEDVVSLQDLRQLYVGGDVVSITAAEKMLAAFDGRGVLYNIYGPTENTTFTTYHPISLDDIAAEQSLAIGKPIANTQTYVLDEALEPLGVGMVGELYTGGAGISIGYLGQAPVTAERFVPNPFGPAGSRLYRTGDLVRWRENGTLEFIGRVDFQVKIRGFRIELGEIESALARVEGVEEVIALAREDTPGVKRLVAYIVGNVEEGAMRSYLRSRVPDYMLPSAFVVLSAFPLTRNGKVDRRALPAPTLTSSDAYVAPETDAQRALCGVWSEVFNVARVGLNDNFFDLGGDSILSIQIASRANKAGYRVSVKDIFNYPTLGELAPHSQATLSIEAEQGLVEGNHHLLPIQHWFFEQTLIEPDYWNQSFLFQVPDDLDAGQVTLFLQFLVDQHDALRLRFDGSNARYSAASVIDVAYHDLSACTDGERALQIEYRSVEAKRALSLSEGPLLKGVLFALGGGAKRLLLTVHHLVIDTVSWRILIEDLAQLYAQMQRQQTLALGGKTSAYCQWGEFISQYAQSEALQPEIPFWRGQIEDAGSDFPRQGELSDTRQSISFKLTPEETRLLLEEVHEAYNTQMNDVLLAALLVAYHNGSSQPSLRLHLEGHGREVLAEQLDLSRTVGWFTTLFPVTLRVDKEASLGATLIAVKERLRVIPNKGIGYGALRYCHPDTAVREQLRDGATALSFNYLGQFDQSIADGPFQFATEYTGADATLNEKHAHSVDIVSMVSNRVLSVSLQYDSGLHSMEAMQTFSDQYQQHLRELIRHCCLDNVGARSCSDFELAELSQDRLQDLCAHLAIRSRNLDSVYPLSPLQEGMLFESLRHEGSGVYATQMLLTLASDVDRSCLQAAWLDVIEAFPILRTGFSLGEGAQALQAVLKSVPFTLEHLDWRDDNDEVKRQRLDDLVSARKQRGFDFSQAPLMSAVLIRWSAQESKLLWTHHHALIDGWSLPQVFEALSRAYQARVQGQSPSLPYSAPYEHYIRWLVNQDEYAALDFWAQYLTGVTEKTPMPLSRSASVGGSVKKVYGEFNSRFSKALCEQLNACARRHRVTLNTLVQAAWGLLLGRCVNSDDVLFGSVSAGRPPALTHVESIVGAMIATTPVRVSITQNIRVSDLLATLQQQALAARDYEYVSLSKIQQVSELGEAQSLFDTVLAFENYPFEQDTCADTLILEAEGFEQPHSPLTLAFVPGEILHVRIFFDCCHYDLATVEYLFELLRHTITVLSAENDTYLYDLPALADSQRARVVEQWNATSAPYPQASNVSSLFEAQALERASSVALRFGDQSLSYEALNRRANQVAHRLQQVGVSPGMVVGLMIERSLEMMVGLLGIIKVGAIYCPLDLDYPEDRLRYIVDDSGMRHCMIGAAQQALSALAQVRCLRLDATEGYADCEDNLFWPRLSKSPLYIMYTSGSTGMPKGVVSTHEGVIRLVCGCDYIAVDHRDVFLQLSPPTFDASTLEVWGALLNGGELVLAPPQSLAVDELGQLLARYGVTTLWLTAAFLNVVVNEDPTILKGLRYLLAGGDVLSVPAIAQVLSTLDSSVQVINGYGPTENTTFTCCHRITTADIDNLGSIPIGKPIANTQVYVLNEALEPLGVGMVGELHTSGAGLSLGYLGQSVLTAERFVPNPFGMPGSRLYRTGDLVRWRADGTLEFIGRVDFQVKIRGYRIELGEVEAVLARAEGVKEVVALAREDEPGVKRLVAYVVGDVEEGGLRSYLRSRVPDFMLPSAFVVLPTFPLTGNGKVDRRALPVPVLSAHDRYVAPETDAQRALCSVWSEVLNVARVGVNDNFFDLGGDSILSIQIASRANKVGYRVSVKDIFNYPTVGELAPHSQPALNINAEQGLVDGEQFLLPIQHWFFEQVLREPDYWNQSFLFRVPSDFSTELANQYLKVLIAQHDALRLRFKGAHACYGDASPITIIEHDLSRDTECERAVQIERISVKAKRRLSIAEGPLINGVLFTLGAGQKRLLLFAHHLVIDTVSWRILIEDLGQLYALTQEHQPLVLGSKTSSYRQWGAYLEHYAESDVLLQELAYWQGVLAEGRADGEPFPRQGEVNNERCVLSATLTPEETRMLLEDVHDAYNTQVNDILLASLLSAYHAWSSHQCLGLHLEGHGREALSEQVDLGRTVGWFTTIFPVILKIPEPELGAILISVKERLRAIPNKGIGYGVLRYCHPDSAMRAQLQDDDVALSFNYLGQFDQSISGGLFQFASEYTGADAAANEKSAHSIDIVSMVTEGALNVKFQYDSGAHSAEAIESFFAHYLEHLRELIQHCCLDDVGGRSSSDFEDEDITEDILDDLWEELS